MNEEEKSNLPDLVFINPTVTLAELKAEFKEAKKKKRFAFVLGNGINRYASSEEAIPWDKLIARLWKKFVPNEPMPLVSSELTLTEIYDIMCLKACMTAGHWIDKNNDIKKETLGYFQNTGYREWLRKKLEALKVPVLTTNYDANIEGTERKLKGKKQNGHSEVYPIDEYCADTEITKDNYGKEFSVWHIHGRVSRQRSPRLGTADYMGLVTYVKDFEQNVAKLFNVCKPDDAWGVVKYGEPALEAKYRFTWLEIFYNSSLCINGLTLDPNETFLRWLLISRKKYLDRIGSDAKGWYICSLSDLNDGKRYFLRSVGFKIAIIEDFDMRYRDLFDF